MPGQVCDQSGVLVAAKIPREEDGEEKGSGLKVERVDRAEAGDCIQEEEGEGDTFEGRGEEEWGRMKEL